MSNANVTGTAMAIVILIEY